MVFMVLGLPLHVGGWWILQTSFTGQNSRTSDCGWKNPVPVGRWFVPLKKHIMIYRICFMVNVMNYDYELLSSKLT